MAGESLLTAVSGERLIYSESYLPYYTYGWSRLHVIRQGRWEYIDSPNAELYDLSRDPMELSDQGGRLPEIATDLKNTLTAFRAENDAGDGHENKLEIDQEALERLRALGYVSMESEPRESMGPRADPKEMIQFHTKQERARTFLNERLYAEAASLLRDLLERDPNNMAAMADLAHALQRLGELDEAADTIGTALAFDPKHQQLLTMLAQIETERGNRERSIEILDRVLDSNPTNLNAWAMKARTQSQMGDANAARETLLEALEIDAQSPVLNTLYAQMVEWPGGRYVEAEQRLRLASARDPFNTSPWRVLGRLLESRGRLEEAEAAYKQGLEYTPDDASLHALYAVMLARRAHPDAEAHLREAIRRESEFRSELYVSLGALLAEKGRLEEAHSAYDKVLDSNPSHPAARNNRAIALAQSGKIDEAKDDLSRLVEEQPRYGDAHNNLAVLLLRTGDPKGAEEHARATLTLMPTAVEAWDTLGAALLQQGRTEEAVEALDQALEFSPNNWSALLNRGQAKADLGEADAAREDLEAALAANNSVPDGYFALARLFEEQLEEPSRARGYYRAFLDKFPRDPRAREVRNRMSELVASP
jgi:tetratricopeptide (TPR) repeat protein